MSIETQRNWFTFPLSSILMKGASENKLHRVLKKLKMPSEKNDYSKFYFIRQITEIVWEFGYFKMVFLHRKAYKGF